MAQHEGVDLFQAGLLGRRINPLRVPIIDCISGVVEQRLPGWGHDQCGRSAFDINPVDIQVSGLRVRYADESRQERSKKHEHTQTQHDYLL